MDTYYHRTNNLDPIASTGRIKALKHLARSNPDLEIEVEPGAGGRNLGGLRSNRERMAVTDAYDAMKDVKDVDNVFLSKDVLPSESYGKYVIEKNLRSPKFNTKLNLIANEYIHPREISVKHNAAVYVPDEEHEDMSSRYSHLDIKRMSELEARKAGLADHARTLYQKMTKKADIGTLMHGNDRDIRRILSPNATIVGSEGLGLDIGGASDRDILVPYKTREGYNRIVEKLKENGFGLQESAYNNRKRDGYKVYSYKDDNHDVDVAVVHGGNAPDLAQFVRDFKANTSEEYKQSLRDRKQKASDAWFFRDTRYKRAKKSIDKEIGITRFHE